MIERMDTQQKKDYSAALLACAAPNRIQVCPLAFAEVGVKQRIAGVLNYRKPKFWVVTLAALLCVSLTAGLLTDPVKATKAEDNTQQTLPTGTEISTTVGVPLNVRSEPTLNAPAIAMLETGTQIQILRTQTVDGIIWAYISADTLTENGWVMAIYLNTVGGETLPTVSADVTHGSPSNASGNTVTVTTKGTVDLYASPTVQGRVVFQLEDGSPVTILRIDSIGQQSWAYVQSVDLDRPGWILVDSLNTESIDLSIYDAAPAATTVQPQETQQETVCTTKTTTPVWNKDIHDFNRLHFQGTEYVTQYEEVPMGDIVSYLGSSVAMDAQSQEWYTVVIYAVKEKDAAQYLAVQYAGQDTYYLFETVE